jgi:type 1 fimbria pilin
MKKIILMAAIATTAMTATPAFAASSDSKNFTIRAAVAQECSIQDPENINFGRIEIDRAPGAGALLVTQGRKTVRQNVWVSCNYDGAVMSLTSSSMTSDAVNDGPDAADFTDVIPLRMGIDAPAIAKMFFDTKTKTGDSKVNADAFHENAELSVVLNPLDLDGKRPLAGRYSAVATLAVGPV